MNQGGCFMQRRNVRVAATLAALLLTAPLAFAQGGGASQTGTINGKVVDPSGSVLPGVTVTISSPSMMGQQTQVTNELGLYRFPAVPPGAYAINYQMKDFTTTGRQDKVLPLGLPARMTI